MQVKPALKLSWTQFMLCHFENVKKKKISIKQYKQFSNSLALLTHLTLFRVELKILLPICLWPQSILAVQRTGAPGTGLQQNWDHSLSHDECVCCIGAQSHGVCVCVALVLNTQMKSKSVSETEQVNAQATPVQILTCRFWSPWTPTSALWFCSPNAKCLLFSLNDVC